MRIIIDVDDKTHQARTHFEGLDSLSAALILSQVTAGLIDQHQKGNGAGSGLIAPAYHLPAAKKN